MPSPFPGMDPYLEHPEMWLDVHHRFITAIADALAPRVRPKYRIAIEKRTYTADPGNSQFAGRPDVEVLRDRVAEYVAVESATSPISVTVPVPDVIQEGYLEVRAVATGEVITAIEILSSANKRQGKGRRAYMRKRERVLDSATHLVEIDLLRDGEPLPMSGSKPADYRILVSRADKRPRADLYVFSVREPMPVFPRPLQRGDDEPRVELQTWLNAMYDRAGYDLGVNYRGDATPPLQGDDATWADALLRAQNLR
ncbi:MAG: DUF4058 family protein [Chloroflexi bacterium]|nr:DUF4058 family protein [Chloroflexota bacterium]